MNLWTFGRLNDKAKPATLNIWCETRAYLGDEAILSWADCSKPHQ